MDHLNSTISAVNLFKVYKGADQAAVDHISFDVKQTEIFGLLGPNGAGKTTVINMLCGLVRPSGGTINICGYDVRAKLKKIKPFIGVVPQEIALYPNFTADENIKIFAGLYSFKTRYNKKAAEKTLSRFGLLSHRHKKIMQYSGGMKRRLNLIVAMLHHPKVLILDEPTVGIDVQSKVVILENLKTINQKGTAIIYTSHQMDEAENFCTDIAVIDNGRLVTEGKPQELIDRTPAAGNLEDVYLHLTGKTLRDQ
jgi:ABC-2 type transport system ATP-binding protein